MNLTGKGFIAGILCLFSSLTMGQGILKGVVTDASNKEPLIGASVSIVGTYKGIATNIDGFYQFSDLKPGDYNIRVNYIGYTEKIFNGIRIKNNDVTTLNIELAELGKTLETVVVVGEKNLVDIEAAASVVKISSAEIKQMNVNNVQEVVAMQAGVSQSPDGLQIRGGRVYETQFVIDGVSATDPLAGTGFGVGLGSNSIGNVEVLTGGAGAEYGDATSGVILTQIKEGTDQYITTGTWQRDNLGFRVNEGPSWNTDIVDVATSGPMPFTKNKLTYFTALNANLTDTYFRFRADQLESSILPDRTMFAPRQDNNFSHTLKLSYSLRKNIKITLTNQHSISVSQNTRLLQVVGNDQILQPGLQYRFSLDMDKANTFTNRTNLTAINYSHTFRERLRLQTTLGRLFVNVRSDANGRGFRPSSLDQAVYDPASIVSDPITVFNPNDGLVFVLPGPGLFNNGGIGTDWHDHYVDQYSIKSKLTYFSKSNVHFYSFGFEHKEQQFQWIDVERPWVGAPIRINDTLTTTLRSIGSSSDVWKVSPAEGSVFAEDEIRYKGIIARVGLMFKYWAPGRFVDDAIANPATTILQQTRDDYERKTVGVFGRNYKARLLPKINVSFPVTDNNVLYFNYGHSMRIAHPRFVYQGLDPVFQDRSFLSNLGNPDIDPEVSVSYELGYKTQITRDLAFTFTAFYKDMFDYIVSRRIIIADPTGRFVEKTFFINQDYARIRGIEIGYNHRLGKVFRVNASFSYQAATGKSNTAAESELQIRQNGFVNATKEQFLAWDRPFEAKGGITFLPDSSIRIGNYGLQNWRVFIFTNWRSGLRYTPHEQTGVADNGRPIYQPIEDQPFAKVGSNWFWTDIKVTYDLPVRFRKAVGKQILSLSFEVRNVFNNKNAQIINPVTGRGYELGDPLPINDRDPLFVDPQNNGEPPFNPARYLNPRQIMFGIAFQF